MHTLPPTFFINRFVRAMARAWVEVTRNTPLLVQIFLYHFVVPKIYPPALHFPTIFLVVCALGFFTSTRIAELMRAGIEAIPSNQRYAALAMGFTTFQTYGHVLIATAFQTIFPALILESMGIVKNSSVAFAISIHELMQFQSQTIGEMSHVYENCILVLVLYTLISLAVFAIMRLIETMLTVPGFQTEKK